MFALRDTFDWKVTEGLNAIAWEDSFPESIQALFHCDMGL